MLFDLQVIRRDGWLVLAPTGELDLASAPRLRQEALQAAMAGDRNLVVDLAGVDFVDSLGAGTLVAVRKRLRALGGELRLARPEPQVSRVLALAGVDRIVEVADSVDAAVATPPGPSREVPAGG